MQKDCIKLALYNKRARIRVRAYNIGDKAMSNSAIRYNHDKHTRIERDIDRMHHYEALAASIATRNEMLAVASLANSTIQDKPVKEIDSLLQQYGFNLSDKE